MAERRWLTFCVWSVSFALHASLLMAAGLLVIDLRELPRQPKYIVLPSSEQVACFLKPAVIPRDLFYRDGRALQDDPEPEPCVEACDSLVRSLSGNPDGSSLRVAHAAPGVFPSQPRPTWPLRCESWRNLGDQMPLRLCRSSVPREGALLPALRWLVRHQNADGSWSPDGFGTCCSGVPCFGSGRPEFQEAVTSLAVLAFLGAGYSSLSKDTYVDPVDPGRTLRFGEAVKRGLQWLMSRQDAEGCVGERGSKFMYNHALATLALSEAYGMTAIQAMQAPTQKAVDFLVAARNPGAGWRYGVCDGETDTSVTGWAFMALKSAQLSELPFPPAALREPLTWFAGAMQPGFPPTLAYRVPDRGPSTIPSGPAIFADHPDMTAVGLFCSQLQRGATALPLALTQTVMDSPPVWGPGRVDFHYWYFGTSVVCCFTNRSGPLWPAWTAALKAALLDHQRTAAHGCENGSWDSSMDRWGTEGGRVYATAINALNLGGLYSRRPAVFGGSNPQPIWR